MITQEQRQTTFSRLGTKVGGLDIPAAMRAANIDFRVGITPMIVSVPTIFTTPDGDIISEAKPLIGHQLTYREDTRQPLAAVGSRYEVIQTTDATMLVEEMTSCGWAPEFAGSLHGGKTVFMAGKLAFDTTTHEIDPYLCFVNSFDGTSGLKFACTPYRPACTNQIKAIFRRSVSRPVVSLRHTQKVLERAEGIREVLGLSVAYYKFLDDSIDRFLNIELSEPRIKEVLNAVIPIPPSPNSEVSERAWQNKMDKRRLVMANLEDSPTLDGIRTTAWGIYNSVTELEQWNRESSITMNQVESQLGNHIGSVPMTTSGDKAFRVIEKWLIPA